MVILSLITAIYYNQLMAYTLYYMFGSMASEVSMVFRIQYQCCLLFQLRTDRYTLYMVFHNDCMNNYVYGIHMAEMHCISTMTV